MKMLIIFFKIVSFIFFYISEIITANWRVAYDIMTIKQHYRDGIVKVKIDDVSTIQLAVLINLIIMTPGTICLSFDDATKNLVLHLMFMDDAEKVGKKIQEVYVPFVKEVVVC